MRAAETAGRCLDYLVHMLDAIGSARRCVEGYEKHASGVRS